MLKDKIQARLKIRHLEMEHLTQFNDLLRYAFQVTYQELLDAGWQEDEIRQSKSPVLQKADVLGWFDEEKLVSQIAVYPMRVNIHGRIFEMGGVTGVATYPEYAGMGLMHELMTRSLQEMRSRGQTISFLYPYSIPFYRKKGWEIVSDKMTFSIRDTQLPKQVHVTGVVERVDLEHPDLKGVHNRFTEIRHGALVRDDLAWEEYWRWDSEDVVAALYYNERHIPLGYVVYWIRNEVFTIKELVYLNEEARHGLWNYISAHFSMIRRVQGDNYTGEPLAFLLEDSEITESIAPYIMARIVDVQEFLKRYPFSGSAQRKSHTKLTFSIADPMAEWNRGIFSVQWDAQGVQHISREVIGEPVEMDIQTLTAMLLSYKRPSYLYRIERIKAAQEDIEVLETLIRREQPYFSDYF